MAKGVDQERQLLQEGVRNINPTDKYVIDNFDDVAGGPKYYGYLGKGGTWYIMRETITGSVSKFEFSTGAATSQNIPAYLTAWTGRASLTYKVSPLIKFY